MSTPLAEIPPPSPTALTPSQISNGSMALGQNAVPLVGQVSHVSSVKVHSFTFSSNSLMSDVCVEFFNWTNIM